MTANKPRFSRRQLNLIIAGSAILIALLSIPTQTWPTIERLQPHSSAQPGASLTSIADSNLPLQLRLLFHLPQAGLLPQPSAQLLTQLLAARLSTETVPLTLHGDRISLAIDADSTDQLSQQLQQLTPLLLQPFAPAAIEQVIRQQRAQRHINRNQPQPLQRADRWLRQQQPEEISIADINQLQQQLFSQAHLRTSLTGLSASAIKTPLKALFEQFPPGQPWSAEQIATLPPNPTDITQATALQRLPGRQSGRFPQTLLLSRIIEQLTRNSFRLYPAATTSWLIGSTPATTIDPNWLKSDLKQAQQQLATMADWELKRAADDLREQLEQRLSQPRAIADQLEAIAFYDLPVDYLPQFDATIAALTGAQIRQQLQPLLQHPRFSYPSTPQR